MQLPEGTPGFCERLCDWLLLAGSPGTVAGGYRDRELAEALAKLEARARELATLNLPSGEPSGILEAPTTRGGDDGPDTD